MLSARSLLRLSVALLLVLGMAVSAMAVDYGEAPSESEVAAEVAAEEAQVSLEDATADETVQELIEAEKVVSEEPTVTAEEKANEFLRKMAVHQGWNSDKKVFISLGVASVDCEDPSYDDTFLIKRSLKAMEATLSARASIIKYIRTEMSAEDKATTPGTDLYEQFNSQLEKQRKRIAAQHKKVMKLLTQAEQAEIAANTGVTTKDRINAFLDAAIKKLDADYTAGKLDAKKQAKYEKIKKRYLEANQKLSDLQAKLASYEGKEKETLSSTVALMSSMPLLGAITVAQFEGWVEEDERFDMVTVVAWSKTNEKAVRAFIAGKEYKRKPKSISLSEWLNSQDWSSAIGGRKFQDNAGETHFIGIGAAALGSSSTSRKTARGIAEMMARKEVATALFADVSAQEQAQQMMKTYNSSGTDESLAMENYASNFKQSLKNRHISGMGKVFGKELTHPISGQQIYVAIFDVTGETARQAMAMEKSIYTTRVMDAVQQNRKKATKKVYDVSAEEAKKLTVVPAGKAKSSGASSSTRTVNKNSRKSGSTVKSGAGSDSFDW